MTDHPVTHWADALKLRGELVTQDGQLADLQMSLYSAVFRNEQVRYRDVNYYGAITEPTPGLEGFMADVMRRLGSTTPHSALFHLDQGMGGGKSHALVGLYHMAHDPAGFDATDLGSRVRAEAEQRADSPLDLTDTRTVVLSADHVTPGTASAEYGPARTLYQRFLWELFDGEEEPYDRYVSDGANKASLRRALEEADRPILILLDEIMEYALKLSGAEFADDLLPGEQAFLADLMEVVNQVPRTAFVLVMIRSEDDEQGYNAHASGFRDFITGRIERNGTKVTVTEPQDFRSILRRRIFETNPDAPVADLSDLWQRSASTVWEDKVFERLSGRRGLASFPERLAETYPFHPDLLALVEDDWARNAGFQRVRSTVRIFAASAHHWTQEHAAGRWAPPLIGVGDVPLNIALEHVLNSGLLRGNDRAIQSFRQVAARDVIGKGGEGRAVELDERFDAEHMSLAGQRTCVRMASALFLYSLVPRSQARTGATKPELMAAAFAPTPSAAFNDIEDAFVLLTNEDEGLGALDSAHGAGGSNPTRYMLSISQTLRMFHRQARNQVKMPEEADDRIWQRVRTIASGGRFDRVRYLDAPADGGDPTEAFAEIDERGSTRLVVLDPHRWSLLNGVDGDTREDIKTLLGLGTLTADAAASCIVACVNTQRRKRARDRALEVLAYDTVLRTLDEHSDLRGEAERKLSEARGRLDQEIKDAFQHFAYLTRDDQDGVSIQWGRFDSETRSALHGNQVWDALAEAGRAAQPGGLSGAYLPTVIDVSARPYTVKEIANRFWQDPAFPLVSSESDVRGAIFEAITRPSLDANPPWQLVDSDGTPLQPPGPESLAIGSTSQILRPFQVPDDEPNDDDPDEPGPGPGPGPGPDATTVYRRYTVKVPNRSVLNPTDRDRISALLLALSDALDNSGADIQLVDVQVALTAAQDDLSDVQSKAEQAGATWTEQDEDF
jgi:Protein of unknown function (DUF499)